MRRGALGSASTTATAATSAATIRARVSCQRPRSSRAAADQREAAGEQPEHADEQRDDRQRRDAARPPSESLTSIVGAGASEDSEPDQLTIEPSE